MLSIRGHGVGEYYWWKMLKESKGGSLCEIASLGPEHVHGEDPLKQILKTQLFWECPKTNTSQSKVT